jgi:predicted nucleic acid-binding protein
MPDPPNPRRVVTNTSPLQYLHTLGQLPLLERLYGAIVVPQAVIDELDVGRQQGYDVPNCRVYSWMQPETVAIPVVLKLVMNLGRGEAEALALSLVQPTNLVLLDDALARQIADSQELRYTGTLGVLIQAKQQGLIEAVMPLVERMQQAGFRLDDSLKETIRRESGE